MYPRVLSHSIVFGALVTRRTQAFLFTPHFREHSLIIYFVLQEYSRVYSVLSVFCFTAGTREDSVISSVFSTVRVYSRVPIHLCFAYSRYTREYSVISSVLSPQVLANTISSAFGTLRSGYSRVLIQLFQRFLYTTDTLELSV